MTTLVDISANVTALLGRIRTAEIRFGRKPGSVELLAVSKTHVLNILHRLTDGKAPPASPIDAPQALRLAQEPLADVGRYDNLRGLRHAS